MDSEFNVTKVFARLNRFRALEKELLTSKQRFLVKHLSNQEIEEGSSTTSCELNENCSAFVNAVNKAKLYKLLKVR